MIISIVMTMMMCFRRMDQTKSETEEITFPFVCFSVDDHEEAWSDIIVR